MGGKLPNRMAAICVQEGGVRDLGAGQGLWASPEGVLHALRPTGGAELCVAQALLSTEFLFCCDDVLIIIFFF